jgi:hypothetical protein
MVGEVTANAPKKSRGKLCETHGLAVAADVRRHRAVPEVT